MKQRKIYEANSSIIGLPYLLYGYATEQYKNAHIDVLTSHSKFSES